MNSSAVTPLTHSRSQNRAVRTCEALLPNGRTRCRTRLPDEDRRLCHTHHREYKELYAAYKAMSDNTERAGPSASLSQRQMDNMKTTSEVDAAIGRVEEWRDAAAEELRARKTHHTRFFRTNDEGHEKRLGILGKQHAKAETLLSKLTVKRSIIVAIEKERQRSLEMARSASAVDDEEDSQINTTPTPRLVNEERPLQDISKHLFAMIVVFAVLFWFLASLL
ncbi:hypothetical protein C8Q74DRAFT_1297850 [Fomes fomentarius]|nr:hypothetical protein C8Q74DRAFT_1297850 [Fomes fomentarius]